MAKTRQQKQIKSTGMVKLIKSDDEILNEFNNKPCQVNLTQTVYSKIGMTCSASSSDGTPLSCKIVQDQSNTFTVTLKRLRNDNSSVELVHESKKPKIAAITPDSKRKEKEKKPNETKKSKSRAIVRSVSKPTPCNEVKKGEIVLCKMKGFPEWPAYVTGFVKNLIAIQFGDGTTHKAAVKNFYKFSDSQELILLHLNTKKNPLYSKAVKEAENALGVTPNLSIFNRMST